MTGLLPGFSVATSGATHIVSFENGRYFSIGLDGLDVLQALRAGIDRQSAYAVYKGARSGPVLSPAQFDAVATRLIDMLGAPPTSGIKQRTDYLHFRMTLLSASHLEKPVRALAWLFGYRTFLILLSLLVTVDAALFYWHDVGGNARIASFADSLWFTSVLAFSTILHEIGHSAACAHYRARHGGIGLGVYYIFPVAFSDVSGAWMLPKHQRMVVNMAGLYMEMMLVLMLLVFLPLSPGVCAAAVASIAMRALFILLPLMRNDGYWMLSDLLSMPDLLKVSNQMLLQSLRHPWFLLRGKPDMATSKCVALTLFALTNVLYMPVFVYWVIGAYTERVRQLPAKLLGMCEAWLAGHPIEYPIVLNDIVALIFCLSLVTLSIRAGKALWQWIALTKIGAA